jgi:hypothetical protein
MHHKRGRAKSRRNGCLFCKPHKHQRVNKHAQIDNGQVRKAYLAGIALKEEVN